ncbi:type 1 glutamine amidotransferase [Pseudonocardia sp. GCM10023141]|uniref:type 1 glutamine amidotransferase n=1 Tax=Pseudonocardia sp. GCM10023141 TaxID=3252653 RepID=UPI0036208146
MSPAASPGAPLSIGVLLPDVLGTYSDAGNATILAQRARWRGIPAEIISVTAAVAPPTTCDIYLLGGGEDTAQIFATEWLGRHPGLLTAVQTSSMLLAVCAGLQILGEAMSDRSGRVSAGLGLLDLTTTPGTRRSVGEVVTTSTLPGIGTLTGFENHMGLTTLGTGTVPLGYVTSGVGNGSADRSGRAGDGALTDRIIGTYMHGPVLARNPALADHLLERATGGHLEPLELPDQAALRRQYIDA